MVHKTAYFCLTSNSTALFDSFDSALCPTPVWGRLSAKATHFLLLLVRGRVVMKPIDLHGDCSSGGACPGGAKNLQIGRAPQVERAAKQQLDASRNVFVSGTNAKCGHL
jgi:hypothetical protein